ncbi:MAG: GAF domain-containing protein [Proteobacteria bacterium]|nr:MAG: GAF domain-containing protein [Pseudomonadota bacterium]
MADVSDEAREEQRLASLYKMNILDTVPEEAYQDLVKLAASICGTPISAITLLDRHRQWFKAIIGLDAQETSRDVAFCRHTILSDELLQITDSHLDERFDGNPLAHGELNLRFYAGAPLILSDGARLGALCVLDTKARELTLEQKNALEILARQVVSQIELGHKYRQLEESQKRNQEQKILLDAVADNFPGALYRCILNGEGQLEMKYLSEGSNRLFPPSSQIALKKRILSKELIHPLDFPSFERAIQSSVKNLSVFKWEGRLVGGSNFSKWVRVVSTPRFIDDVLTWDGVFFDVDYEKNLESLVQKEKEISVQAMKAAAFGKLANGLAHEINNPLAIIKGICFVVERKTKKPDFNLAELNRMLSTVAENVDRITKIMSSLQGLAVSGQRQPLEITTLGNILETAEVMVTDDLKRASIELEIDADKSITLRCRSTSISRAIANLLLNSCEALTGSEKPWIKIHAREKSGILTITVTDSGFGIKLEDRPFVMDPFYTTKDVGEGNGLGLAVSRAVLEDHEGGIELDITHKHTTFVITLPTLINTKVRLE